MLPWKYFDVLVFRMRTKNRKPRLPHLHFYGQQQTWKGHSTRRLEQQATILPSGFQEQHYKLLEEIRSCHLRILVIVFQRVLTAEYVDACKVDDVEDLRRRGLDVADVSLQYYIPNHKLQVEKFWEKYRKGSRPF